MVVLLKLHYATKSSVRGKNSTAKFGKENFFKNFAITHHQMANNFKEIFRFYNNVETYRMKIENFVF